MPLSEMRRRLDQARSPDVRRAAQAEEQRWSCYNPEPGHPTKQEKQAFVNRISQYAVQAEKKHKVPAAAIVAMALVESGYGFTRTARSPNHNIFGWKISAADRKSAGGFVLTCQDTTGESGKADPNRCYRSFQSEEQAVDFVASRLASGFTKNYKRAFDTYQRDTKDGRSTIERVQAWVAGIADPYNWKPREYVRIVCRLMRDPINGSNSIDVDTNLYRLSARPNETLSLETIMGGHRDCATIPLLAQVDAVETAQKTAYAISSSTNGCPNATSDMGGWPKDRLRYCEYQQDGRDGKRLSGAVYLLKLNSETIASWINAACNARMKDKTECFRVVLRCGVLNSGMMFPVEGNIIENRMSYYFRNGMTVVVKGFDHRSTEPIDLVAQRSLLGSATLESIPSGLTRLWRTRPEHMAKLFPNESIPQGVDITQRRDRWLQIAKAEMTAAIDNPSNRLLDIYVATHSAKITSAFGKTDAEIGYADCPN